MGRSARINRLTARGTTPRATPMYVRFVLPLGHPLGHQKGPGVRSPSEPTLVHVLVVFESQEKARARNTILDASRGWNEFGQRRETS